ncbi:alpha-L-rhamnosidase-related protein [Jiulongibacter sediminis]|uniref:Alpha-rhamnosidase n=1 Tax=Jiulongibacter sediminis TaxID=1605367 RepID=A0A0P7BX99_9BACT|nr:alpha-L-rhamnosidase C-terminal domain-containing protein [Jiulongibacter sediminis]KPM46742.1 alpha-rhamnosidase [Jiulongibacter sediminis]TBX21649.1 alpha-rhamnosidase [Jiulongibacter sediminis]
MLKYTLTRRTSLFSVFFLFFFTNIRGQQIPAEFLQKAWPAKWISVPETDNSAYGVYIFRKSFVLNEKPESFPVFISADNRYKLFVNGQWVGTGPAKSDLFNWNFDILDLAAYLQEGSNLVSVKVWNEADYKPEFQISHETGLIIQGSSENSSAVNTDKSWKCIQDLSYEPVLVNHWNRNGPFETSTAKGYYVAGPGEKIMMSSHLQGWEKNGFNDEDWSSARLGNPGIPKFTVGLDGGNSWRLIPSYIPQMELTPQRFERIAESSGVPVPDGFPKKNGTLVIPANTEARLLIDQSFLTNAYPSLHFSGGNNARIDLMYAEALYQGNNKGNRNETDGKKMVGRRDVLISNGQLNQEFTTLAYRTFRYIELKVKTENSPLTIHDIYSTFTGYPFERKDELTIDNQEMHEMLKIGWRTARLCANETYMDCPYYEQLQYIGDTRIQGMVTLYTTGDQRLVRNALDLMDRSRMIDGLTRSRYPTENSQIIPTFSLWYIGMLHDYLYYGDDLQFVKQKLGGTREVLSYFEQYRDVDGSVKNLPNWFFVDWADHWKRGMPPLGKDGSSSVLDLQLLLAYQYAADLEKQIGLQELSQLYERRADDLKKMIVSKYWDQEKGLIADTPEKDIFSQHANAMAILSGLIDQNLTADLAMKLKNEELLEQASIYFKYYVHLALTKAGFGNEYLAWLDIWRSHMDIGLTTWGEDTDANTTRSDCHAWGASPNIEFYRTILGIKSGAPGFEKIVFEPHLGDLKKIAGKMPHPKGMISVDYDLDKGQAILSLPQGVTGEFLWNHKSVRMTSGENKVSLK